MERRICGIEDTLDARDTRWQKTTLAWGIEAGLPGVLLDTFRAVARQAFASWSAVAGLTFIEAASTDMADIVIGTGSIDGALGTLAWSELPPSQPCHQRYDTGETWSVDGTPTGKEIELLAVMAHEIGHALGLQHDAQGSAALMAPYYSPKVLGPQARDVSRIQVLYGPPKAVPVPPVTPPTGPASVITIVITNADRIEIPGYNVTPK